MIEEMKRLQLITTTETVDDKGFRNSYAQIYLVHKCVKFNLKEACADR